MKAQVTALVFYVVRAHHRNENKNVVKTYGFGDGIQIAVVHMNFTIDEGEFAVILGHSEAGKWDVLQVILLLLYVWSFEKIQNW